jgi:AraC-like DNA-binding protein
MRRVQSATTSTHGILRPETGRAMFALERIAPAPDLSRWVERHWIVRWDLRGREPYVSEVLPHPCVNLVSEPGLVAVHGISGEVFSKRLEGAGVAVGTKFRPGGIAGFIHAPAWTLNDRSVALGELWGEEGAAFGERLAAVHGDARRHIKLVEDFLRARVPPADLGYERVLAVVRDMLSAPPGTTVASLATRHAVSERTLQRLFREYVGVGPKWVLKRYRMHEAAERLAAGEADDGAALALDLGYFDQSHFIRDFTAQIGVPPGAYARACAVAAGRAAAA